MKKIAINGFGRIGRVAFKIILDTPGLEVVAINDLMNLENAAYLFKFDSVYGHDKNEVTYDGDSLIVNGNKILFFSEMDPEKLPWRRMDIDVVMECTGKFTSREDAEKHILAGSKTVVISGPTKSPNTPTVVFGVNTDDGRVPVFSCGSCTTNSIGPVIEIIGRRLGIKKAILTTVHSFTSSQSLVDSPSKRNARMGRSGAINLVPGSTGAAIAVTKVLPQFEGKFDGMAVRTPSVIGSISDITLIAARHTTPAEVNTILEEESKTERYHSVLSVTHEPYVSSDIIGSSFAAVADLELTRVVDGDLVKVMVWYDNEWGFTNQMIRQIAQM